MTIKELQDALQQLVDTGAAKPTEPIYFGDEAKSADYIIRRGGRHGDKLTIQEEWF